MERVLIEPVLLTENPFRPFPTDLPAAPVKEDFSAFNRVMKEPSSLAENRFHWEISEVILYQKAKI